MQIGTAIQALQNAYLAGSNSGIGTVNPTAKFLQWTAINLEVDLGYISDRNLKRDIKPYKVGLTEVLKS
ncbi:MAG: hypothetical protein IPJ43_20595 [Saprospiraceae bacterium]|nr:hypothetical protein [Saprospiraceae bacterium]